MAVTTAGALQEVDLAAPDDFAGTGRPGRRVGAAARELGGRKRLMTRFGFAAVRAASRSATLW
jgi:hypothetical protein